MTRHESSVTLPFDDFERATAALRGELRLAAAYGGSLVPDWETLEVTGPDQSTDDRGRSWFTWSAAVETLPDRTR